MQRLELFVRRVGLAALALAVVVPLMGRAPAPRPHPFASEGNDGNYWTQCFVLSTTGQVCMDVDFHGDSVGGEIYRADTKETVALFTGTLSKTGAFKGTMLSFDENFAPLDVDLNLTGKWRLNRNKAPFDIVIELKAKRLGDILVITAHV